jgi:hypothetical protein
MANRQNTFLLKRSNVSGKIPLAGDLQLGELALNTADVVLYASGTTANSILPIGWDRVARTGDTMTGTLYAPTVSAATLSATVISFNTTYTGATPVGSMTWNTDFGVPQVGMVGGIIQKIGETIFAFVKNGEATTLNKGEVVYIFGATGDKISVKRASNTGETTSSKTLGVVAESIISGGLGYVITQGTLDGLNLGVYTAGDTLWLSNIAGQYTNVKQYAPNHTVFIGVVQRANNGNGQLYVLPQNGYELEELHNVMTTGATYGDLLTYSAYNGNNVWTSSKVLNGDYSIKGNLTVTGNTNVSGTTTTTGDLVSLQNLKSMYSSGDEGGEIFLNKAATNTTLSGGVTVDIFQNRVRIFEQAGTNRGVYIDLTAAAAGIGTNLLSGGGGEINTASNLGSGTGLFAQKVAADLQFKSLTSTGGTVTISDNSTTVNLEAISSSFNGGTVTGSTNFTNGLTANTISATTLTTPSFTANTNGLVASTVNGVYVSPYVTIGAAYTATTANSTIEISGGTFTLVLYTAVGNSGRTIYIKNSGSGIVTVDANASETIDGQLTRPLANMEDLFLQSNGTNWVILNRKPVVMQFSHDSVAIITPADATTYYIGNFTVADPATTSGATRQVIALSSGWVKSVTLMISVAGTLASAQNSTFSLKNATTGADSTISSTVQHTTIGQLLSFTLATPMLVTKGDLLQINWRTPTWGTNPSSVRQYLTALIE